ncbi:MAG TPA: VOC family protein, partial [Chitinophagaceae bacterium]
FFVNCETQEEIDHFWNRLTAGGGQESMCGWLKDKFGVSWQIVPPILGEMLSDKNKAKAGRVMQSMMGMKKIIIDDLKKAYNG